MKIRIILGMLLLMVLFPLCKKESPTEPISLINLHIEGVVTDITTNKPIFNVKLELFYPFSSRYKTSYTDKQGFYSIKLEYQDSRYHVENLILEYFKTGYNWSWTSIRYTEELQIINIQLEPR